MFCIPIRMRASPPSILSKSRMRRCARTDLCGGRSAMVVPTATVTELLPVCRPSTKQSKICSMSVMAIFRQSSDWRRRFTRGCLHWRLFSLGVKRQQNRNQNGDVLEHEGKPANNCTSCYGKQFPPQVHTKVQGHWHPETLPLLSQPRECPAVRSKNNSTLSNNVPPCSIWPYPNKRARLFSREHQTTARLESCAVVGVSAQKSF